VTDTTLAPGTRFGTVIFDLDGVLVDSFAVMEQAFAFAYQAVVGDGRPPFAEYREHMGRYFPDIMDAMGLPRDMEEPFVLESARLAREVRAYPGVPQTLERLRGLGVATAVATGKSGVRARSLLEGLDLARWLDVVVGSDEVPRPKPAPDIVLECLRRLGRPADDAVMVGDAVNDLLSARTASVRTAAALWGAGDPEKLRAEGPDFALERLDELLGLVRRGPRAAVTAPGGSQKGKTVSNSPVRWGVVLPQGADSELAGLAGPAAWSVVEQAAQVAAAGAYESVWVADRTDTLPRRSAEPVFEAWTALAALSGLVERVRLGVAVSGAPLRNAALLAKRAASLDVISRGRLELAFRTRDYAPEVESVGLTPPAPADLEAGLTETVEAVRALWSGAATTYQGDHVRLADAHCVPTPVHSIPVALRLDGANPLPASDRLLAACDTVQWQGSPEQVASAIEEFSERLERAGSPPDRVRHSVLLESRLFDSALERDRWLATPYVVVFWSHHPDVYAQRNLYGTTEQVADRLQRYRSAGATEFLLWFRDYPDGESLKRFAQEVAPAVAD